MVRTVLREFFRLGKDLIAFPFLQLHRSKVIALHARGALENEANVHSAIYILIHAFRLKRIMDVVVDAGH